MALWDLWQLHTSPSMLWLSLAPLPSHCPIFDHFPMCQAENLGGLQSDQGRLAPDWVQLIIPMWVFHMSLPLPSISPPLLPSSPIPPPPYLLLPPLSLFLSVVTTTMLVRS